jgi:hypothetical protein
MRCLVGRGESATEYLLTSLFRIARGTVLVGADRAVVRDAGEWATLAMVRKQRTGSYSK